MNNLKALLMSKPRNAKDKIYADFAKSTLLEQRNQLLANALTAVTDNKILQIELKPNDCNENYCTKMS